MYFAGAFILLAHTVEGSTFYELLNLEKSVSKL